MATLSPLMNLMRRCMHKAVKGLLRDFNEVSQLQVSQKGPGNFVTIADKRTEELIYAELHKARSSYGFIMEEGGEIKGEDVAFRWIVDPLDGTTNFLHSLPYFCVTFALEKTHVDGRKEIIAAITEAPILKETYWAEKGHGAWVEDATGNVQRLRVANRKVLTDALLCVGSLRRELDMLLPIRSHVAGIRCLGSTALALAYVASGRLDIFLQQQVEVWDMAAGILLVKEAGGVVCDLAGSENMLTHGSILAGNSFLIQTLQKNLSLKI